MKALYTYFGQLDLHEIDTPGHSLYQLGLLESIRETWNTDLVFDFYSYYPESIKTQFNQYPDTPHGRLFTEYFIKLINTYHIYKDEVISNLINKEYDFLFLKARFRNLSTLSKKWKDARDFEKIIDSAIEVGYTKDQIIILDTDLSLSELFIEKYSNYVTIKIPSIDFPGIGFEFLDRCIDLAQTSPDSFFPNIVYYGNINTSNYKEGNQKDSILGEVLTQCAVDYGTTNEIFYLITKRSEFNEWSRDLFINREVRHIDRWNRPEIFMALANSMAMVNVTKDKYDKHQFIPARIYEAMIFGMVPISFKFNWLSSTFSFETIEDFDEICKYLFEISHADRRAAYTHFIKDYTTYANSLPNHANL